MTRTALVQKCYQAKPGEVTEKWYLIDAKDQVLGRLAVKVATMLMGKDKPTFTPHVDTGAFIVVINADKIRVTGKKAEQKTYEHYTRHPSGRKIVPYEEMLERHPDQIISLAVWGMMPKNTLGKQRLKKLKVYAGAEHPHAAQNPEPKAV
jgi:large subunit ribosomal protein L13